MAAPVQAQAAAAAKQLEAGDVTAAIKAVKADVRTDWTDISAELSKWLATALTALSAAGVLPHGLNLAGLIAGAAAALGIHTTQTLKKS